MRKYINAGLSLASIMMLFYIVYNQREQIKELKAQNINQNNIIDSLSNIIIDVEHTNTTYEMVIENISERDSTIGKLIDEELSNVE